MKDELDLNRLGERAREFGYDLGVMGTWPFTAETDATLFRNEVDGRSFRLGNLTLGQVENYLTALSELSDAPPQVPDLGRPPLFYWESLGSSRPEIPGNPEVYLAVEINWARLVLNRRRYADINQPNSLEPRPLEFGEHPEDELLRYSDAVSSILLAATYVGIDADEVCRRARSSARGTYREALDAAVERNGGTHDG